MTVAEIEGMDRAALVAAWSDIFRTPVPKGLSKVLMRRFLAIEIQTRQMGGLGRGSEVRRTAEAPRPAHRTFRTLHQTRHILDLPVAWIANSDPGRHATCTSQSRDTGPREHSSQLGPSGSSLWNPFLTFPAQRIAFPDRSL